MPTNAGLLMPTEPSRLERVNAVERPVQITLRNIDHSDALEEHIRERAARLEKFHPRIMTCQVVVEIPHKHKHQGNLFNVRLDVKVPGNELVFNREARQDVYVALRDVFEAARRKLEDHSRRQRGDTKVHAETLSGRITRLFPQDRYGFIETDRADEYYFSETNVVTPAFDQLKEGDEVQFIADLSGDRPQAKRLSIGKHHLHS
jgi:ribosomal subunit interface protein